MPSSWIYFSMCFFLFTCISIESAYTTSFFSTTVSYTDHCSTIVPQSTPTIPTYKVSIPYLMTSYIIGGDRLLSRKAGKQTYYSLDKSLNLEFLPKYYETVSNGIYKVEALLYIHSAYRKNKDEESIRFLLEGFWSKISSKLCMVGSAYWEVEGGKFINLDAVLKLNYASEKNPTIYSSVVSGSLESADSANDPSYFDPILVFSFPVLPNYNYSLVSRGHDGMFPSDFGVPGNQLLGVGTTNFCSVVGVRRTVLELEYAMECREPQHCSPLGFLPSFMSLIPIQCSEGERKLRYMAKFQHTYYADTSFGLDSTLVVEASWDNKNYQLFGVACRLLDSSIHLRNAVGDCTMRLSLRYPSIWTIRNDAKIVGQIWSSKAVKDSGYFRKINLTSAEDADVLAFPGARYEYTELNRVRKLCPVKKPVKKGNAYPAGNSYAMKFDLSLKNSKGELCAWGYATPLSVGNMIFEVNAMAPESACEPEMRCKSAPLNFSYKIRINPFSQNNLSNWFPSAKWSMNLSGQVEITAEGVYNAEKGYLCMVGCRKLVPYFQNSTSISRDCEIVVKFEFAPFDENRGGSIKGTIKSARAKADPLYFEDLSFSSSAFYPEEAERSIWRMDLEITMFLISNTLSCIFVGLQILHVKRNPEVPSFISLVMLLVLSVGHVIPLVLNIEAPSLRNHKDQRQSISTGGRLEANEVTVRLIALVAFLLQLRLLQLVWSAKQSRQGNKKRWWIGEKMASFFSVSLYILGGFLTLLLNWISSSYGHDSTVSLWGQLRSYAGLILDGFLLPQILLNIFRGSAEKVLCPPFYIGISAIRLVPHAYNEYRARNYPTFDVKETYYYANPEADLYSTAWDIIIPCGIIALAVVVFKQQQHVDGGWIILQRFKRLEMYEKVPTVENEENE